MSDYPSYGFPPEAFDPENLPGDDKFVEQADIDEFAKALVAPSSSPFISLNDWKPIHQRVRRRKNNKRISKRTKDETREGYVWAYEFITWRGRRHDLRKELRSKSSYKDWKNAAQELDRFLGNEKWKDIDDYGYYDSPTISRAKEQLSNHRKACEELSSDRERVHDWNEANEKFKALVGACV